VADRINPRAMADTALTYHCRLSIETMHARFSAIDPAGFSIVFTVNSGYE
jgi:hypothetical protein